MARIFTEATAEVSSADPLRQRIELHLSDRPTGRFGCYPVPMSQRSIILEAARNLTLEHGVVPSLNSVASLARVSKGGLMHHFPSRSALMQGLAVAALEELDAAMLVASAENRAGGVVTALGAHGR